MMTSAELRKSFLDFFASKGHTIVPSASIVPDNDPTLLFTNAGMNQFKDVFLGQGSRTYKRAADTQKCMRVSGKHNDLDDVGKDTYHHTLFEMLGNWSFGDYYKKEAISWAWELITQVWKLPKDKLYATVYKDDDEAFKIWGEVTDISKDHILKFAEKDNFWEMGSTGPCGPCSEIHIDRGEGTCDKQHVPGHVCAVNAGCARYIELWNLVFMQYNREEDGTLKPLPNQHVDTGMGFERVVAVIQNKKSNYDTDLFQPILKKIETLSGKTYNESDGMPFRVIADHIRSLTFSMADGVMPSNEGRGYVIRKILRRAIRYGRFLGFNGPFLNEIVDTVADTMGHAFPEVNSRRAMVKNLILSEEESFFKTLARGLDRLNELVDKAKTSKTHAISGEDVFMLYDSLGLPLDFIEHTVQDEGLSIDREKFDSLMEQQKERARAHFKSGAFDIGVLKGKTVPTEYTGEEKLKGEGDIQLIASGNAIIDSLSAGTEAVIITDRTPFYGEKGGQVGDTGVIETATARFIVTNTRVFESTMLHYGKLEQGSLKLGETVKLSVDAERRAAIARNHTATHLLHKALREVVGNHAAQAGSLVGPERLRFDFTHSKALSVDEIHAIENRVNHVVLQNRPVSTRLMSKDEAVKSGAVAIFEEKYGETVRVVDVEDYSRELCGGSHVKRTGDIGLIKVIEETSISAGTRRLEAVTGMNSLEEIRRLTMMEHAVSESLNSEASGILERIRTLQETLKTKDKEISELKRQFAAGNLDSLLSEAATIGGTKALIAKVDGDADTLLAMSDTFKTKVPEGVLVLMASPSSGKVAILASVGKTLNGKLKAGDIARECAKIVGGGGGGRPDLAQAGGKDEAKIPEALEKAKALVEAALK